MTSTGKNMAYDMSLFEERKYAIPEKDNILKLPKKRIRTNKKSKLNIMTVLFSVFTFFFGVAIIGTILFNQVQLTEIADKTNQVMKQLEETRSENTQLQMKVKEKFSPEKVTYRAKNDLSMEQTNPCQVEYFSLSTGDKAEITQEKQNTIIDNFLALVGIR